MLSDPNLPSASEQTVPTGRGARLTVQGLSVRHGDILAVHAVSLDLLPGHITAICGPNGSGKSTLLRALSGLHKPHAGTVLVDDEDLAQHNPRQIARLLSFLPQSPLVPAGVTVREVVEQGRFPHRRLLGGPRPDDQEAVAWALASTRLDDLAERDVAHLSGGERQRVWIAMALAQRTSVLLLDEPTTFLDIRYQLEVLELVRHLADEVGITVALVLHDLNQAATFADRLVLLRDGRVVAAGPPDEVLTSDHVEAVFGVRVTLVEDPVTGRPACLLRRSTTPSAA